MTYLGVGPELFDDPAEKSNYGPYRTGVHTSLRDGMGLMVYGARKVAELSRNVDITLLLVPKADILVSHGCVEWLGPAALPASMMGFKIGDCGVHLEIASTVHLEEAFEDIHLSMHDNGRCSGHCTLSLSNSCPCRPQGKEAGAKKGADKEARAEARAAVKAATKRARIEQVAAEKAAADRTPMTPEETDLIKTVINDKSATGYIGVCLTTLGKYRAECRLDGKKACFGTYPTAQLAALQVARATEGVAAA